MTTFVLATANPDKAREIAEILGRRVELRPRPSAVPEVEETGVTLLENALLKARSLVEATGMPAIADDTGLEVDALGGAPGVYSARFAGPRATYKENVEKLIDALAGQEVPRTGRFRTVAVAVWPGGLELVAEGVVEGEIALEARGDAGFGYDPVFVPIGSDGRTFGEMTPAEKHEVSHRGAAFRALAARLSRDSPRSGDRSCR